MKKDLTKLENLTDQQLHTISTDVEKIGFRNASAKAASELGRDIDTSTVQRFVARGSVKEFLDETPDTAAAATEVLRYAATGIPSFTDATVQVLDQTAFKLSLVCTRTEEEMKALTQVNTMLHRHRSQSVRERMAAVQERKAKLREQELEFRRSNKPDRNPNHRPQSDSLGPLVLTGDDIERRTCTKFNLQYNQDMGSAGVPPADEGVSPESSLGRDDFHGVPNIEKPLVAPRESAALSDNITSHISTTHVKEVQRTELPSGQSSIPVSEPSVIKNSDPLLASLPSVPNSVVSGAPDQNSEICILNSEIEVYRQTEKNSEPQPSPLVTPKQVSGGGSLPSSPSISNSPPREAPDQHSGFCILNSEIISHAIRRWRAYQPRRYQDPEPTLSWTDECPCGVKTPCEQHRDLSINVRYLNPADPKYAAALKEAGISHYIPTPDELTRPEPTDMPCTSVFYAKIPAQPTDPDQPLPREAPDLDAK